MLDAPTQPPRESAADRVRSGPEQPASEPSQPRLAANPPAERVPIVAVHLNNDFSGAPSAARNVLQALRARGHEVRLFTSRNRGFLSGLDVEHRPITYRYTRRFKVLSMAFWLCTQLELFFKVLVNAPRGATVIINTIQPFGAALAARLRGLDVVYWVHETVFRPRILKGFLFGVLRRTASAAVYVSRYLRDAEATPAVRSHVIYNTRDPEFFERAAASTYAARRAGVFSCLLVSSLRDYKGVREFVELARAFETRDDLRFELKVNAPRAELAAFLDQVDPPANLVAFDASTGVHERYASASLVLNLSRPDQWIETFGLTLLEAMAYGIPVLAPEVGGPTELVEEGVNGYLASCYEPAKVQARVRALADDEALCRKLSAAARTRAAAFGPEAFATRVGALFESAERRQTP